MGTVVGGLTVGLNDAQRCSGSRLLLADSVILGGTGALDQLYVCRQGGWVRLSVGSVGGRTEGRPLSKLSALEGRGRLTGLVSGQLWSPSGRTYTPPG